MIRGRSATMHAGGALLSLALAGWAIHRRDVLAALCMLVACGLWIEGALRGIDATRFRLVAVVVLTPLVVAMAGALIDGDAPTAAALGWAVLGIAAIWMVPRRHHRGHAAEAHGGASARPTRRGTTDPSLAELIALCERVLAVDIDEDELARAWPDQPADPALRELRDELFSGLEHVPGTVSDGRWRLDPDQWRETPEYYEIHGMLERLRSQASMEP